MNNLTAEQSAALTNLSPRLNTSGIDFGALIDSIISALTSGNLGIGADAWDIDAIAKDGENFAYNANTTLNLTLGVRAGRIRDGQTIFTFTANTILLPASQANVYVEMLYTGGVWTLSQNTVGFTAGSVRLFLCTTGISTINTITNKRILLDGRRDGAITGNMLSTPQKTIAIYVPLGTIATAAGTTRLFIPCPNCAGKVTQATLVNLSNLAASDANYAALTITNLGTGGAGATVIVDGTQANNTTKVTGGSALVAKAHRAFNLHATPANLVTAANETLQVDVVVTGTLANTLPATMVKIEIAVDA